ncbi:hypothetical protein ACOMHN_017785 [Nucella lapillus]
MGPKKRSYLGRSTSKTRQERGPGEGVQRATYTQPSSEPGQDISSACCRDDSNKASLHALWGTQVEEGDTWNVLRRWKGQTASLWDPTRTAKIPSHWHIT